MLVWGFRGVWCMVLSLTLPSPTPPPPCYAIQPIDQYLPPILVYTNIIIILVYYLLMDRGFHNNVMPRKARKYA